MPLLLLQTFYMYDISPAMACLIVTVLIVPLAQVRPWSASQQQQQQQQVLIVRLAQMGVWQASEGEPRLLSHIV